MRQYFEKMDPLGKPLSPKQMESMKDNIERIEEMMRQIDAEGERIKNVGVPLNSTVPDAYRCPASAISKNHNAPA